MLLQYIHWSLELISIKFSLKLCLREVGGGSCSCCIWRSVAWKEREREREREGRGGAGGLLVKEEEEEEGGHQSVEKRETKFNPKKKREREKNREKRFRPTSAATSALLLLLLLVSLRFMNFPSSFLLQRNENENNMGPPLLPILLFLFLLVHLMTLHCITPIVSTVSMLEASWRASELGSDIEFSLADLIGIFAGNPSSLMFNWTESPGDWCWLKLIL